MGETIVPPKKFPQVLPNSDWSNNFIDSSECLVFNDAKLDQRFVRHCFTSTAIHVCYFAFINLSLFKMFKAFSINAFWKYEDKKKRMSKKNKTNNNRKRTLCQSYVNCTSIILYRYTILQIHDKNKPCEV